MRNSLRKSPAVGECGIGLDVRRASVWADVDADEMIALTSHSVGLYSSSSSSCSLVYSVFFVLNILSSRRHRAFLLSTAFTLERALYKDWHCLVPNRDKRGFLFGYLCLELTI